MGLYRKRPGPSSPHFPICSPGRFRYSAKPYHSRFLSCTRGLRARVCGAAVTRVLEARCSPTRCRIVRMDSKTQSALIGAGGAVLGAAVGALIGKIDSTDIFGKQVSNIKGDWESTWTSKDDPSKSGRETLTISKQRGTRVHGRITYEKDIAKKWEFEGRFSGQFLQLYYYPSKESRVAFLDYGCYFFELRSTGDFEGYSVGIPYETGKIGVAIHTLRKA